MSSLWQTRRQARVVVAGAGGWDGNEVRDDKDEYVKFRKNELIFLFGRCLSRLDQMNFVPPRTGVRPRQMLVKGILGRINS